MKMLLKHIFSKARLVLVLTALFFSGKILPVVFVVTNTNDSGVGSLRQCIINANASPGNDQIIFNLGAGGPFTINLLSALPALTDNTGLTIDGWDNSGNNGTPNTVAVFSLSVGTPLNPVYKIILGNGANIPVCFSISSSNNLIRGIVMQNFGDGTPSGNDITIFIAANNNTITGCYIGMDVTGTTSGNFPYTGIYVSGNNNRIGDGTPAGVNLISGLRGYGNKIYFIGSNATANIVRGNVIGLQANGTSIVTGTSQGITLISGANSNTIGGLGAGDGNLISGNSGSGISVGTNSNVIQGNYIGPLSDGVSGLVGTPQGNGLNMGGSFNLLGGSTAAARNLISGNTNLGMDMSGSSNRIQGNYWGTTKTGMARLSVSNNSGMALNSGITNTVGGTNPGEGNLISGFPGMAIWMLFNVGAVTNCIQQNTIGLAANGTSSLTGGGNGTGLLMMLNTSNNLIGGSTIAARNIIGGSGTGISMSSNCGGGNQIRGNYIGLAGNGTNNVPGASQGSGIAISSLSITTTSPNVIGGTGAGEGNVISGNTSYGINLSASTVSQTAIYQNTIGTQANGTSTLTGGNSQIGIYINGARTTTIGGSSASHRNIISANNNYGVYLTGSTATNNVIQGNYIGPGASGSAITGASQAYGVMIQNSANTNTIGGYLGGVGSNPQGNVIAFNTQDGIYLTSAGAASNLISRNRIYTNGAAARPINLNYGVNQGNGGKAVPVIMTATTSMVTGSAAATAGVGDTVEVFANTTGNCRDMMTYKGSTLATAAGNWTLTGITINPGESVVATARTVANNNTSEASICTVPLPVELLGFDAICEDKKVRLYWATASELNSDHFVVEKALEEGNYKFIGKLNAAGRSSSKKEYWLIDGDFSSESVTYRLKQVDRNGQYEYFFADAICDHKKDKLPVNVYPNPVNDNLVINIPGTKDERVNVDVFDGFGNVVFSQQYILTSEPINLKTAALATGMYILKINSSTRNECVKFLKN